MNEPGKSDKPVVPAKPGKTPNKENYWDFMERVVWAKGRGLAKENEEHDEDGADEQSSKPSRSAFLPVGPAKQVDRTQSRLEKRTAARGKSSKGKTLDEDLQRALDRVRQAACRDKKLKFTAQTKKVNWILDADIRGFFDTLNHQWLMKFVEHRIADPHIVRQIQKWLSAGVMEKGKYMEQEEGTPQGGSIWPLLANLYLHYVLDLWADQWRKTQAQGDVIIVRYADDFVVGFEQESDAVRFLEELKERFRKFNLELHAQKTRVIEFGRFASEKRKRSGQGKPDTFNFLGFTHICDKTRKGNFIVLRRSMAKRVCAKLKLLKEELWERMHESVRKVGTWLTSVLRGHYQYYGVPRNFQMIKNFRHQVRRLWHRTLNRRSQKARLTEMRMTQLATAWLPTPRICQPYPSERLAVIIQGKSPVR